ncbi:hypothetical protein [Pseudomonas panipatensis]|jgi:hypothetical protein|uniref:Secreted protein n=1 Tax=Pseudomonas panipatensis TaxID=428992 RepID=A0A1G8M4A7_9PSED|nr:hypothetical protein [Pseudomonas panipatensis]SDI62647.1 hypothetical protein SAMN05216272_11363 [Pseudomonas panipatensis]SMP47935.1 hypothetical protein SAMN06295951_102172 [Pseudomonas panipatensis]
MSRNFLAAALLSVCSLSFVQMSFAEESSLMTDKMVKANQAAIAGQSSGAAERTAGKTAQQPHTDS